MRFPPVQPRARSCSARQSILLTEEILFDYLIDSVVQKLVKLESVEKGGWIIDEDSVIFPEEGDAVTCMKGKVCI